MFNKLFAFSLACMVAPAFAETAWETDLNTALKKAEKAQKRLMVEFTGSDWCGYCKILKKQVLDTDEFAKATENDFVLVELDYPRSTELPPGQKEKNEVWKNKFKITGYPTIVFLDMQGKPYGNLIGSVSSTKDFMKVVQIWEKKREQRDTAFAAAKKAEGMDKAKLLLQGLNTLPEDYYASFYQEELDELKKLDKNDELGLLAKMNRKEKLEKQNNELMEIRLKYRNSNNLAPELAELSQEERKKIQKEEFQKIYNNPDTLPEVKQRILFETTYMPAGMEHNKEKMIDALKLIIEVDANTGEGKQAASIIEGLKKAPDMEKNKNAIPATRMILPGEEKKVIPATKIVQP